MVSRRLFLKSGGAAMFTLGFAPSFLARAAEAAGARPRLLIAIFQRGAVDGLNMVIPYGEADYYRLRPTIAIPRPGGAGAAIDLDGFFALHPSMAPLKPLWDNRTLAIVHACGSPDVTRSHFDAQDYMETATPGVKSTRDGWLNRVLQAGLKPDTTPDNPLRAVALSRQMPRAMQGRAPTLAFGSLAEFTVRGGAAAQQALEAEYASDPLLGASAEDAFEAMRVLRALPPDNGPENGAEYPRSPFGQALREIARLAKADVGLEIAFTDTGNWDHHAAEGGVTGLLASRLDDFSTGSAALVADLGERRMADTVIVTMSEFGRTVAENGTRGTDHGHGNAMFAIGGAIKGGQVRGRWPGLGEGARFEGRDLAVTTDFRDVFGEIVSRQLNLGPDALARVFPGRTATASVGLV